MFTIQWMMSCARITIWICRYTTNSPSYYHFAIIFNLIWHSMYNIHEWFIILNGREFEVWRMLRVCVEHRDWLYCNSIVIDDNILIYSIIINSLDWSHTKLHGTVLTGALAKSLSNTLRLACTLFEQNRPGQFSRQFHAI